MISRLAKLLFALAKTWVLAPFVGLVFQYASGLLPVERVRENQQIVAFQHPRPVYPHHLVIAPKHAISTFDVLTRAAHREYWGAVLATARQILATAPEFQGQSWVLCVNGGNRQDVKQVHFHLFTRPGGQRRSFSRCRPIAVDQPWAYQAFACADSEQQQFWLVPTGLPEGSDILQQPSLPADLAAWFRRLAQTYQVTAVGYTLALEAIVTDSGDQIVAGHLWAAKPPRQPD